MVVTDGVIVAVALVDCETDALAATLADVDALWVVEEVTEMEAATDGDDDSEELSDDDVLGDIVDDAATLAVAELLLLADAVDVAISDALGVKDGVTEAVYVALADTDAATLADGDSEELSDDDVLGEIVDDAATLADTDAATLLGVEDGVTEAPYVALADTDAAR